VLQTGLFALLSGNAAIAAIAGSSIFPVTVPESTPMPALTYQIVGGNSMATLNTSGLQKLRMQFDCYGNDYLTAATLRETLRQALNGFVGQLADGTFLQNAELIQNIDFFENDARQFRCMAEFYLFFDFTS
jgi:hypothetical protein